MTGDADQRRIKRQLHAQPQNLKIHCGRGLRAVAKAEVERILASCVEPHKFPPVVDPDASAQTGAIAVVGIGFRNALELSLRCGAAKEILLEVGDGRADTAKNAHKVVSGVPWSFLLAPGATVALRATSLRSRLFHEGSLKETAGKLLVALGFALASQDEAQTIVDVRLVDNKMTVSLSIPGAHLSHRGYKAAFKAAAPMREDIAAAGAEAARQFAMTAHGDSWQPGRIIAPFAGSGTLGFEATRAFLKIAPGLFREDWPFLAAPCAPEKTVAHLLGALRATIDGAALAGPVVFIEKDPEQCQGLRVNCASFNARLVAQGVPAVAFDIIGDDVFAVDTAGWGGQSLFLAVNPPYGIRLDDRSVAQKNYKKLGGWIARLGEAGLVTGYIYGREADLALTAKGLAPTFSQDVIPFVNGGLKLGILVFTGVSQGAY